MAGKHERRKSSAAESRDVARESAPISAKWAALPWLVGGVALLAALYGVVFRKERTIAGVLREMERARVEVREASGPGAGVRMRIVENEKGFLEAAGLCARRPEWGLEIFRKALARPGPGMKIQACRLLFYLLGTAAVEDFASVAELCGDKARDADVRRIALASAQEVLLLPVASEAGALLDYPDGYPKKPAGRDGPAGGGKIPTKGVKLRGRDFLQPCFDDPETFAAWLKSRAGKISWDPEVKRFVAGKRPE
ncbi:MAG: hypothetical protein N3A38_00565 [Planctomycetota bacterium]|nr:hypothetical protein [Planctomycetota bacterium]